MTLEKNVKQFGFVAPRLESDNYVLGAFNSLPKEVIQPNGQWDKYLPKYEPQAELYETWGCTVWGTQNALEILHKRLFNEEINADERYNYNCVEIEYPGSDPHKVGESIRKQGMTFGIYPITPTYEEFCTPRPVTDFAGQSFLSKYSVGHEWVTTDTDKKSRVEAMKEALRYSPLGVSVTAWIMEDGIYVDKNQPNNHWCVVYGYYEANGETFFKVFDSYDHSEKILHPDHTISYCKRYSLTKKVVKKKSFWSWLLEFLGFS